MCKLYLSKAERLWEVTSLAQGFVWNEDQPDCRSDTPCFSDGPTSGGFPRLCLLQTWSFCHSTFFPTPTGHLLTLPAHSPWSYLNHYDSSFVNRSHRAKHTLGLAKHLLDVWDLSEYEKG